MKVKFNFNLAAWISQVEIEADSKEEAEKKLLKMDILDIIQEGFIENSDLDDIEGEVVSKDVKVKVSDIEYTLTDWDYDVLDLETEEAKAAYRESLPKEMELSLYDVSSEDDLKDKISDGIFEETDVLTKDFKYKIISER